MIAQTEICSDRERILALLAAHRSDACVRQLFADLDEIDRLMEYYSFRTPQLADRFIEKLERPLPIRNLCDIRLFPASAQKQRQQLHAS